MLRALLLLTASAVPRAVLPIRTQSDPDRGAFLPSLEGPRASADEWMRRFEASGGRSRDALWSLYWRDDRSEEVLAFLQRWFERSRADVQAEIETILMQWGRACPAPRHEVARDGPIYVHTGAWYAPPAFAQATSGKDFLQQQRAADVRARLTAALDLVQQQEHVALGLARLLALDDATPDPQLPSALPASFPGALPATPRGDVRRALRWAMDHAGTAAIDAVLAHVAESTRDGDPFAAAELRRKNFARIPSPRTDGPRLRELYERFRPDVEVDGGDDRATLLQLLAEITRESILYPSEFDNHPAGAPLRVEDPELADRIVRAAERWIARPEFSRTSTVAALDTVGALVARCPEFAQRLAPTLSALTTTDGEVGLAALRALCHGGVVDENTFDAYVRVLEHLPSDSREAFELVPCLPRHTPETTAALERFATRASNLRGLARRLIAGDILDLERSPPARRLHAALQTGSLADWPSWHLLLRVDSGWRFTILPDDSTIRVLWKTLVTARSKRAAGEDVRAEEERLLAILAVPYGADGAGGPNDPYETAAWAAGKCGLATPRFHKWALRTFLHAESSLHIGANMRVLEHAELDERERALLARVSDGWFRDGAVLKASDGLFHDYIRFLARRSSAVIEWAGRIRHTAHRSQRIDLLDVLLGFAKPAPRDLAWIEAAIRRGPAREREHAIGMVARHGLYSESLVTAVRTARADVDRFVAQAARELCLSRGW